MKDINLVLYLPPFLLFVGGLVMLIICIYLKERKDEN